MYAFQNGAEFMSKDGRTCTLYSPESAEALQFVVDGYEALGGYERAKAFETGFQGNENDPFMTGKVAMKIDGDWILSGLARYAPNLDFSSAPPPVPDDRYFRRGRFQDVPDPRVTWVGGFCYGIPKGAKSVDGAWRFIKFATSTEGRLIENAAQQEWERLRGRTFMPRQVGNREANEAILARFRPGDANFAEALRQHTDMMPFGRIRPVTFAGQRLWDEHVRALENACYKRMSPRDALMAGQVVVQRELDEFYAARTFPEIDSRLPIFLTVAILTLLIGLAVWFYRRQQLGRLAKNEARWAYLFIAPWVIGFLVFTLGPMVASLFYSFTKYDVLNPARFVGFKNYADLFTYDQANIVKAFSNVLYLALIGVPLNLMTGLAIALLLNAAVSGLKVYRTIFYIPSIFPLVASAVLWIWILAADPNKGLINAGWQSTFSSWFGVSAPGWLNSEAWSKNALILMGLWGAGSGMILWLAGLKGVSKTLYEASSIDGADPNRQFWSITLPQLSSIIFFNMVMGFIGAIQEFDRVFIMKPGDGAVGPGDSLLVPVYHLFVNGFTYFKMGYASALAWVIFAIILLLTVTQLRLSKRWVHYEVDR
jgi:multiple sugar transport system permease protein